MMVTVPVAWLVIAFFAAMGLGVMAALMTLRLTDLKRYLREE